MALIIRSKQEPLKAFFNGKCSGQPKVEQEADKEADKEVKGAVVDKVKKNRACVTLYWEHRALCVCRKTQSSSTT